MHATEFPVSTPMMVAWAVCLAVAAFFFVRLLNALLRKSRRTWLLLTFLCLLTAGTVLHVVILSLSSHTVTDGNWIQLTLMSLVAGLEMFIGHTVLFDDIFAAVIFHLPGLLLSYLTVFVLVLCFSFMLVLQILPRRLWDRIWLAIHASQASAGRKNHVFIGISPGAKLLAKSILDEWEEGESDQGTLLFIDIPEQDAVHTEISLGDIFTSLVSRRKEVGLDEELGSNRFVLLKGDRPAGGREDLCSQLGLPRLRPWLHQERTSVYLLGGAGDNAALLDSLLSDPDVKAKVFCLADKMNRYDTVSSAVRGRVRIVDPHLLAVQQIKFQKPELHPIHFVDIARDADGNPLGYVDSGFHALHVGFRRTGQEMLRFLYEFGSFVGKDRMRVPTTFDIFDDDLEMNQGDFLNLYPGMREDEALVWNEGRIGSARFWDRYAELIDRLNYVVISTGDAQRNLELGVQLFQTAARLGKDWSRFVILVRLNKLDDRIRETMDFYNRTYLPSGKAVLQPFGVSRDVWNLSALSGRALKDQASRFYAACQQAVGGTDTWETRAERLSADGEDRMRNTLELLREQGQDLSRSAYIPTLRALAGDGCRESEYLVIQEHLRWNTSHRAAGYVYGPVRDELLMRMPDLLPFDEVEDTHSDWIAVQTALNADTID